MPKIDLRLLRKRADFKGILRSMKLGYASKDE
jgi:hypothetical protein